MLLFWTTPQRFLPIMLLLNFHSRTTTTTTKIAFLNHLLLCTCQSGSRYVAQLWTQTTNEGKFVLKNKTPHISLSLSSSLSFSFSLSLSLFLSHSLSISLSLTHTLSPLSLSPTLSHSFSPLLSHSHSFFQRRERNKLSLAFIGGCGSDLISLLPLIIIIIMKKPPRIKKNREWKEKDKESHSR